MRILCFFFVGCLTCFFTSLLAQTDYTLADTVIANQYMKEFETLFDTKLSKDKFQKQFAYGLTKLDTARFIFKQIHNNETKQFITDLKKIETTLNKQGRALEGIEYDYALVEDILNLCRKVYGEEHIETADTYMRFSLIFSMRNQRATSATSDSNFIFLNSALTIYTKILGENSPEVANTYTQLGRCYLNNSATDKAIECLEKANLIYSKFKGYDKEIRINYATCSNIYERQFRFEQSYKYRLLILDNDLKKYGTENQYDVAFDYSTLSRVFSKTYDYDKAIVYGNKAINILIKIKDESPAVINVYLQMGELYLNMEDYDKAIEFYYKAQEKSNGKVGGNTLAEIYLNKGDYDKALNFVLKTWEINKPPSSASLLSKIYIAKGSYEKAFQCVQESLEWSKKTTQAQWVLSCYLILGETYYSVSQYQKAIETYHQASKFYQERFGLDYKRETYYWLGKSYEKLSNYDSAHYYYQKVLEMSKQPFSNKNLQLILPLSDLGRIEWKKKDFITANAIYSKILKEQGLEDTVNINNIYMNNIFLDFFAAKADFERNWFLETSDIKHIQTSAKTYQQAIATLDNNNRLFFSDETKTDQKKKRYALYEGAIETSYLLKSVEKAFEYSERSKANILQSKLKESDALYFAGLPDSLLEREKMLRLSITTIEKNRQERINTGKNELDSFNIILATRADTFRTFYADLKKQFEKAYPDYYRLKYDYKTTTIGEVQQTLLGKDQTLLSYFVGDSAVYAFVVRPDTFAVFEFKKDFPLENWVKLLRGGIYGYHTANTKTEKLYETTAEDFATAAFQLYNRLIDPLSNLLTKEVIVVPDGALNYVPFDVLLTQQPKDALKFDRHSYFGNRHIISYNYSATLWQEMRDKRHKVEPSKNFIGFAPYYNGDTTLLSSLFSHDVTMRKGLDSLKYSGEEVFIAQKLMQGEAILNQNATKSNFEKMVGDYRIVHLATHGKANDKVGDYSFLAFTEQKDSLQNELLYVRDIYNLRLNADLVVLSACETGIGELRRGEGVISLARAFAYAGAKSLVTTLWSVNDKSTLNIMEGFYRQLRKGAPKNQALWQAKLDYLAKSKSEMAHPFFWAAFVPIGDINPIKH